MWEEVCRESIFDVVRRQTHNDFFLPNNTGSMKTLRPQYGLLVRRWTIRNMIRDIPHIPLCIYVGRGVSRINISYGPTPDPSRIFSPLITGSMKTLLPLYDSRHPHITLYMAYMWEEVCRESIFHMVRRQTQAVSFNH